MISKTCIAGGFSPHFLLEEALGKDQEFQKDQNVFYKGYEVSRKDNSLLFMNARIYNEKELIAQVKEAENLPDALLSLFLKEGIDSIRKINGKYIILIKQAECIYVFRDRHGEGRQFFYDKRFFSDSIHMLLKFENVHPQPDFTALCTYLNISYIPSPLTGFKGINKLAAGNYLVVKKTDIQVHTLFDYEDFTSEKKLRISEEEAAEEWERLFKESIKRRIGNQQLVGALLSGGYDSGGNIATIPEVFQGTIKSYSIGFKDNPYSELPFARMMAEKFGADHHEYLMDGSEIQFLPEIIYSMGMPFSESGFMLNHAAMKLSHNENLPVVIGGDGSDQLFGTSGYELGIRYKLKMNGGVILQNLYHAFTNNASFDKDNIFFRIRFQNEKILNILQPEVFGFKKYHLHKLLRQSDFGQHPLYDTLPKKFISFDDLYFKRNYFLDIRQSANEIIINKASRMSEMFDTHLAFSYIDLELYNFLKQLPVAYKLKGNIGEIAKGKGISKYLLKKVIKPRLPDEVTSRKKQGGFSPLAMFFADDKLRNNIFDYIKYSSLSRELFDIKYLNTFIQKYNHSAGGSGYWFWYKQVFSNQLMNLLVLTLWWDMFMENKAATSLSNIMK